MTTRTVFLIFDDGKTFKFVLKKKTPAVRLVQKVATTRGLDPGACSLERVGLTVADDEDVHSGGGADVHLRVIERVERVSRWSRVIRVRSDWRDGTPHLRPLREKREERNAR